MVRAILLMHTDELTIPVVAQLAVGTLRSRRVSAEPERTTVEGKACPEIELAFRVRELSAQTKVFLLAIHCFLPQLQYLLLSLNRGSSFDEFNDVFDVR